MSNFNDLPSDVLHTILDNCYGNQSALGALSLTSRHLHSLALRHLYQSVSLTIRDGPIYNFPKTASLLKRTLASRPDLTPFVKVVTLKWSFNSFDDAGEDEAKILTIATDILTRLLSLRALTLEASGGGRLHFPLTFLSSNPLYHLQRLNLNDPNTTFPDIQRFLRLPSLKTLCIETLDLIITHGDPPSSEQQKTSSPLQILETGHTHLPASVLRRLLRGLSKLQKFTCLLPGTPEVWPYGPLPFAWDLLEELSPAELGWCLQPVKNTLVELCVGTLVDDTWPGHLADDTWPGHDRSRLDLSEFEILRVLKVSAEVFFEGTGPEKGRDGISALLGQGLEELEIIFGFERGILCAPGMDLEAWKAFDAGGQYVEAWKYKWLEEIAEHKATSSPNLRIVTVREIWKHPRSLHTAKQWKSPETLERRYKEAGVRLEVWIRKPRDYERERQGFMD